MLTEHGEPRRRASTAVRFDHLDDDDEEEDGDFIAHGADEVDEELDDTDQAEIEDELRELQRQNAEVTDDYMEEDDEQQLAELSQDQHEEAPQHKHKAMVPRGDSLDLLTLDQIAGLRVAFPTAPVEQCEKALLESGKNEKKAYKKLLRKHPAHMSVRGMIEHINRLHTVIPTKSDVSDDGDGNVENDLEGENSDGDDNAVDDLEDQNSDEESVDSLAKHYDRHGFPAGLILAGMASTHMAKTLRQSGKLVKLPVHTKFEEDDEDDECDEHDADAMDLEPSNSQEALDEAASDVSSDSEQNESSSERGFEENSSDEEDDSESDSDGSDSGPEVASSKNIPEPRGGARIPRSDSGALDSPVSSDDEQDDSEDDSDSESDDESSSSGFDDSSDSGNDSDSDDAEEGGAVEGGAIEEDPGRNQHEDRDSDSSRSDESDAHSSPCPKKKSRTAKQAAASNRSRSTTSEEAPPSRIPDVPSPNTAGGPGVPSQVPPGQGKPSTRQRNRRRRAKAKLKREEENARARAEISAEIAAKKAALLGQVMDVDEPSPVRKRPVAPDVSLSPNSAEYPNAETDLSSAQHMATLDNDVGGGTLILEKHNTGIEDDHIRSKVNNDVRTSFDDKGDDPHAARASVPQADGEKDPEAWRQKIAYRAVECVERGTVLSEPPFPFVQRWDPQQRGKSKRKQRNDPDFYDTDSRPSAKKRRTNQYVGDESYMSHWAEDADVTLNYDDEHYDDGYDENDDEGYDDGYNRIDNWGFGENYNEAASVNQDPDVAESNIEEDDIPSLPNDLSTLPLLQTGELRPGMVLAWKQMLLSKATNWQPEISTLAGTVVETYDDGSMRVRLGHRYRGIDRAEKTFDEDGNRVYDKFELPGMDDEMEEDMEAGYRTLTHIDMILPRVLQRPAEVLATPQEEQVVNLKGPVAREDSKATSDESKTLDNERSQDSQSKTNAGTQQSSESVIPDSILPEVVHSSHEESQAAQHRVEDMQASEDIQAANAIQASDDLQMSDDARTHQVGHAPDENPQEEQDISMTEDRREEISQLIRDASFRKDVDPSIADEKADLSSPSRQLEEMMAAQQAAPMLQSPEPQPTLEARTSSKTRGSSPNLPVETEPSARNGSPQETPGAASSPQPVDSQPILLEPFNGFSDDFEASPPSLPEVSYPRLAVPEAAVSDSASVRSGRQPDPAYSIDLGDDEFNGLEESHDRSAEDSSPPLSRVRPRVQTPLEAPRSEGTSPAISNASSASSNLFPDISEISSSRLTQSTSNGSDTPSKMAVMSVIKAQKSQTAADKEYEEAMRRLDEGDVSEQDEYCRIKEESVSQAQSLSNIAQRLVDKPIEKPVVKKTLKLVAIKTEKARVAPPPRPRVSRSRGLTQTPFSIPEGSQVVSLVSSSPEPEVHEDYAEDSIDETYEEPDMPKGPGWVSKRVGIRRGMSLPASSAPRDRTSKPFSASQGRQSVGPLTRPKKKTSLRGYY